MLLRKQNSARSPTKGLTSLGAKAGSLGVDAFSHHRDNMEVLKKNMHTRRGSGYYLGEQRIPYMMRGSFRINNIRIEDPACEQLLSDIEETTALDGASAGQTKRRTSTISKRSVGSEKSLIDRTMRRSLSSAYSKMTVTSDNWFSIGSSIGTSLSSILSITMRECDDLGDEGSIRFSAIESYAGFDHKRASLDSSYDLTPTDKDVLSGRGAPTTGHPGNIAYREFIKKCKPEYLTLRSNSEKSLFSTKVKEQIENNGGRFLQRISSNKETCWALLDAESARQKCSQSLRQK